MKIILLILFFVPIGCYSQMIFFCNGKKYTAKYEQREYNMLFRFNNERKDIAYVFQDKDTIYTSADSIASYFTHYHYEISPEYSSNIKALVFRDIVNRTDNYKYYRNDSLYAIRKVIRNEHGDYIYEYNKDILSNRIDEERTYYNEKRQDTLIVYTYYDSTETISKRYIDTGEYSNKYSIKNSWNSKIDTFNEVRSTTCSDTVIVNKPFIVTNSDVATAMKNAIFNQAHRDWKTFECTFHYMYFIYTNGVIARLSRSSRYSAVESSMYNFVVTIKETLPDY